MDKPIKACTGLATARKSVMQPFQSFMATLATCSVTEPLESVLSLAKQHHSLYLLFQLPSTPCQRLLEQQGRHQGQYFTTFVGWFVDSTCGDTEETVPGVLDKRVRFISQWPQVEL